MSEEIKVREFFGTEYAMDDEQISLEEEQKIDNKGSKTKNQKEEQ